MRNASGPKTTGNGTAYGKQDTGSASKVPFMGHKESMVLSFFHVELKNKVGFHSKYWD